MEQTRSRRSNSPPCSVGSRFTRTRIRDRGGLPSDQNLKLSRDAFAEHSDVPQLHILIASDDGRRLKQIDRLDVVRRQIWQGSIDEIPILVRQRPLDTTDLRSTEWIQDCTAQSATRLE